MKDRENNTGAKAERNTEMTKTERLTQIQRRTTRYEVILSTQDGATYLVGYTIHKSGAGLLHLARGWGDEIIKALGITDDDEANFAKGRKSLTFANKGTITFSGKTERDAICSSELQRLPL